MPGAAHLSAAVAVLTIGPAIVCPPASADPYTTPADSQASCDFSLSHPSAVQLPGGAPAVTATMSPTICHGSISVTKVTVCVDASTGPSKCNSVTLNQAVQVYLPTAAAGTFTSRGELCGLTLRPLQTICMTAGPYTTTL